LSVNGCNHPMVKHGNNLGIALYYLMIIQSLLDGAGCTCKLRRTDTVIHNQHGARYLDLAPIFQIGRVDFKSPKSGAPLSDVQRKIVFDTNNLNYLSLDHDPV